MIHMGWYYLKWLCKVRGGWRLRDRMIDGNTEAVDNRWQCLVWVSRGRSVFFLFFLVQYIYFSWFLNVFQQVKRSEKQHFSHKAGAATVFWQVTYCLLWVALALFKGISTSKSDWVGYSLSYNYQEWTKAFWCRNNLSVTRFARWMLSFMSCIGPFQRYFNR